MLIYKFKPYLKSVIWGGDRIAALKSLECDSTDIGESWEISGVPGHESVVADGPEAGTTLPQLIERHGAKLMGERALEKYGTEFPLLVKFIDARSDLSVQVHPDDALAAKRHGCAGKTEMWYIISADPDAKIYAGLKTPITADDYTKLVEDKQIMNVVATNSSHSGAVFFLPAGRIHAIGAGNLLLEIQQTSDITYRVYDYDRRDAEGNPRQLHTELAKDAIDYRVFDEYVTRYDSSLADTRLAQCQYFTVDRHIVDGESIITPATDSFTIVVCVEGKCTITCGEETAELNQLQSALVAADARQIKCAGKATIITANY